MLVRHKTFLSMRCALLIGLGSNTVVQADVLPRLPALGLERGTVTVSGLSSGAYMAGQFEVAYSSSLAGAAVLAGGPYGCSRGALSTAMFNCSCPADTSFLLSLTEALGGGCQTFNPDVYLVFSEAAIARNHGAIDDTSHLQHHRIWLLSGGNDHVVDRNLVTAAETFYRRMGVPVAQIEHKDIASAGHGFPTVQATEACSATRTPYLTQCHVDAAGELLQWLYPDTPDPGVGTADNASLKSFKQARYGSTNEFNGLDGSGWLYVPKACEQSGAHCQLHVVFHGCEQGQSYVTDGRRFGTQFVKGAGYNRWAEAGNLVILYPQVKASNQGDLYNPYRLNPKGCWDFWGYTEKYAASNPNFAKQSAPQMKAVKAMIDDLLRSP
jgi:poly(3-hydroxybutyrate) depolymerase